MGEYFKPLRRKFGVLTLVMACVFAAGWLRSLEMDDEVRLPTEGEINHFLTSSNLGLEWTTVIRQMPPQPSTFRRISRPLEGGRRKIYASPQYVWSINWCGFRVGGQGIDQITRIVPYWSIVIPLTLLSAYLLLNKPRQRKVAVDRAEDRRN